MRNQDKLAFFEDGRDEQLGQLYRDVLVGSVSAEAVGRLRARVERAVRAPRRRVGAAAGLGLAAALLLAVFVPALHGPGSPRTVAEAPGLRVVRAPDGAVILAFDRPEAVHQVAKSLRPEPGSELWTRLPVGGRLVDRNGMPAPGTVVFYRVD